MCAYERVGSRLFTVHRSMKTNAASTWYQCLRFQCLFSPVHSFVCNVVPHIDTDIEHSPAEICDGVFAAAAAAAGFQDLA